MKKLKVIAYFFPAVISLVIYTVLAVSSGFGSIHPLAWCFVALLFVSAVLMLKNKWWGCIGGLLTGGVIIYMGTQYTGQVINESPIGIGLCIYFIICGIICYRARN